MVSFRHNSYQCTLFSHPLVQPHSGLKIKYFQLTELSFKSMAYLAGKICSVLYHGRLQQEWRHFGKTQFIHSSVYSIILACWKCAIQAYWTTTLECCLSICQNYITAQQWTNISIQPWHRGYIVLEWLWSGAKIISSYPHSLHSVLNSVKYRVFMTNTVWIQQNVIWQRINHI